ncbi:MAG TPA: LysE family translocator [Candidatus Udaeobacter sp.]|jgi:threonine/homoserine/homoserine lactone efflux protein|nr:LysE family translocator [Candidatus Udaeobacter sp.]
MNIEQALLSFTLAAGLLTITPGLDTALVLRTAAVEGKKQALLAGVGICSGCLLWGAAASFGLSALLAVSGFAYNVLRIVGAIYLGYLGIKLFIRAFASTSANGAVEPVWKEDERTDSSLWLKRGFLTNLLNPKVGMFYLSFLPQFIPAGVQVWSFSVLLASIHATEGILWFLLLANATESLSSWLRQRRVVVALDSAMGAILIAFGLKLALDKAR